MVAYINFQTAGKKISIEESAEVHILRTSIRYEGGLPYRCAGGRCGTCKLHVEEGYENLSPVKKAEREMLGSLIEQGYRLGCQTYTRGACTVSWDTSQSNFREFKKLRDLWLRPDLALEESESLRPDKASEASR